MAPLQIYCSALIFAPKISIIRQHFSNQIPYWIRRLPDVLDNWSPLQQTLENFGRRANSVAFSPDGKLLASGHGFDDFCTLKMDGSVKLWDAATGALQLTLESNASSVKMVTFSPDGKLLASCHSCRGRGFLEGNNEVKLWDTATGALQQTFRVLQGSIDGVAFSSDSKLLVPSRGFGKDSNVKLWDAATGALQQTFESYLGPAYAAVISPDGKLVAAWYSIDFPRSNIVKLWDAATGALQLTLKNHSNQITGLAISPDGNLIATCHEIGHPSSNIVKLWNTATGALRQTLKNGFGWTEVVAFSPDSKLVALSSASNGTVKLWDTTTGALQTLKIHSDETIAVAISPDGKLVAASHEFVFDSTINLWDITTVTRQETLESYADPVSSVVFSRDGKLLASCHGGNSFSTSRSKIKLWDATTGELRQTFKGANKVTFSPDSKLLASFSHVDPSRVKLWDVATGGLRQALNAYSDAKEAIFSPDSNLIASYHSGIFASTSTFMLWDTATGALRHTFENKYKKINSELAFSPDSKLLIFYYPFHNPRNSILELWDTAMGALRQIQVGHLGGLRTVVFSPDCKLMASRHGITPSKSCALLDGSDAVKLWDVDTGALRQTLRDPLGKFKDVIFSPDNKLLASSHIRSNKNPGRPIKIDSTSTIKLWDVTTGSLHQTLKVHSWGVKTMKFSPDGKLLVSTSRDRSVKVWDTSTGALQQTLKFDDVASVVRFSKESALIKTRQGITRINLLSPGNNLPRPAPLHKIRIREPWVCHGEKDMLWLPPDYRPNCTAVYENIVALGNSTGHVCILEFAFSVPRSLPLQTGSSLYLESVKIW